MIVRLASDEEVIQLRLSRTPFSEGDEAGYSRGGLPVCPYTDGSREAAEWWRGLGYGRWCRGRDDAD